MLKFDFNKNIKILLLFFCFFFCYWVALIIKCQTIHLLVQCQPLVSHRTQNFFALCVGGKSGTILDM